MKGFVKGFMVLGMTMSLSMAGSLSSLAEVSWTCEYARDKESGLMPYYDQTTGLYGYVDSNNNNEIAIPAKYYSSNAFFNGYAVVRLTDEQDYGDIKNIYALIDESGTELFTDEFFGYNGGRNARVRPNFYNFIGDPNGYVIYSTVQSDIGLIYSASRPDGTGAYKIFSEFAPIKNEDGLYGFTVLGNFVNGSANVYIPLADDTTVGEFGEIINNHRLIGSITSNGEFSEEINPDSKYERGNYNQVGYTAPDSEYERLRAVRDGVNQ